MTEGLGHVANNLDDVRTAPAMLATDASHRQVARERCRRFMARKFGEATALTTYERAIKAALSATR